MKGNMEMTATELFNEFRFADYNSYDRTKNQTDIAEFDDMGEGILPMEEFITFLLALKEEAGEDWSSYYLRSRSAGDDWFKALSVVMQKDKTPEELEAIARQQAKDKANEAQREKNLYLHLKAKYEA